MVKLLVYYHPDSSTAAEIEDFTLKIAADCIQYDIGLMLEPLSYSLNDNKLTSDEKMHVVVETARRLTNIPGVDILKTEFPLDEADEDEIRWALACANITQASATPWILLSAAVSFELYLRQVVTACKAGASGIAVGRAVWQEAVGLRGEERVNFLRTTARERLTRLNALCIALARPVHDFYNAQAPFDWFGTY
jgi:tagatose 1,6-diphosphate aldolase